MPQTEHQQTESIVCERFVCPTRGFHGPHHPVEGPHWTWVRCFGCKRITAWSFKERPVIPGKPACNQCNAPEPAWTRGLRDSFRQESDSKERDVLDVRRYGTCTCCSRCPVDRIQAEATPNPLPALSITLDGEEHVRFVIAQRGSATKRLQAFVNRGLGAAWAWAAR